MKQKGPENPQAITLARTLMHTASAKHAPVWKRIAHFLLLPRRKRITVTLAKLSRYAKAGQTIIVPGKLLSTGSAPTVQFTLAAASGTKDAIAKLSGQKNITLHSIEELMEKNPTGKGITIII